MIIHKAFLISLFTVLILNMGLLLEQNMWKWFVWCLVIINELDMFFITDCDKISFCVVFSKTKVCARSFSDALYADITILTYYILFAYRWKISLKEVRI